MKKIFKSKNIDGLRYSITLLIVVGLIMAGAWIFHVTDPTWGIVSAIISTELNVGEARSTVTRRIAATLIGSLFAFLILLALGPGYAAIALGLIFITLLCHYIVPLQNGWKIATAAGAMILVAGLQQHSVVFAEEMALRRTAEVISGSLLAGMVSLIFGYLWPSRTEKKS